MSADPYSSTGGNGRVFDFRLPGTLRNINVAEHIISRRENFAPKR